MVVPTQSMFTPLRLLMFVPETNNTADHEPPGRQWAGQNVLSHKTSDSFGVGVLSSRNIITPTVKYDEVIKGRVRAANVK